MSFKGIISSATALFIRSAESCGYIVKQEPIPVPPPKPEMGDTAFGCFSVAKEYKKNPVQIALEIATAMNVNLEPLFLKAQAVGPYVNLFLNPPVFVEEVMKAIEDNSLTTPEPNQDERIMVEFSQPNTHKAIHVGHIRNMVLGAALVRILRHEGYETIPANYIGDSGAHIAACLWYYNKEGCPKPPQEDKGEWLGSIYSAAKIYIEENPDAKEEVSQVQQALERKDPYWYNLWKTTRKWSLEDFNHIYKLLGIEFDVCFYESEEEEEGKKIVEEYLGKGIFRRSEGAVICEFDDMPPALVLKSDGTTLYLTKDLALAKRKFEEFKIDRSIYVVGDAQSLHFKQVFAILKKMGFKQADKCYHLSYGMVNLPQGKMSSRTGNVVYFSELYSEMLEHVNVNYLNLKHDWDDKRKEGVARQVVIAAITFGMLSQDARKPIEFRMEDWLSFEGETGPYVLYAYARICSIQRKAKERGLAPDFSLSHLLVDQSEQAVLKEIYRFDDIIEEIAFDYKVSSLPRYLIALCKAFSSFYHTCPVLQAEPDLAKARLALIEGVRIILGKGLDLLGINPPEEM